jgi:prefoldin subunit 5
MPSKSRTRRRRPTGSEYATKADIAEIHRILDERRNWLESLEGTCKVQFQRIAQIQAELDEIRRAWRKRQTKDP